MRPAFLPARADRVFCGPLEERDGDALGLGLSTDILTATGGESLPEVGSLGGATDHFAAKMPAMAFATSKLESNFETIIAGGHRGFSLKSLHHGSHTPHHHQAAVVLKDTASAFGAAPAAPASGVTQAQVDALAQGFEQTLTKIESNLVAQVFGETLPLLGSHLVDAAASGVPGLHYVTALKTALNSGLATLSGSPTYTEAQVEGALTSALNAAGINAGAGGPNLDLSDPSDIKLLLVTSKVFAAFDTPLDAQLGLPGLNLQTSGTAHSTPNYSLSFGVGLDGASGTDFYLNTAPGSSSFNVALDTKVPGFSAGAKLGPLEFTATDLPAPNGTDFNAGFAVTLKDPNNDGHLRPGEVNGDLVDATLSGNAAVRLHLASNLGTAVLPDIGADLNVDWGFSNAVVDPAVSNATFGNVPAVAFKNVSLGLGSFFNDFVSPIFETVQTFTDPLQPIVDVLLAEVPFLSALAGERVTLLDVAGGIGQVDPETASRLELYADLINFINSVPTNGGAARIDLGDFSLGGQDPRAPIFQLANAVPQSIRNAIAPGSQNGDLGNFLSGKDALPGGGLSFPIIENPATAINLLFGKPVDFFTYHVPGLDINGLGFDEFFRIFGPFGVRLTATVEAHAFLDIGYDSSGVTQFAASGDPGDIFNGFFVIDQPGPEGTLVANLQAFAAANIIVAEVGVGGGIIGNLDAFLNDTDFTPGDGRIHIGELSNSCVFSMSGEVVAGLSAYVKIGFGPFSETFEKTFGTSVLTSFNASDCDAAGMPGVPVLAHNTGATVALHVGADASLRQIGSLEDSVDDFVVIHVSGALGSEVVGVIGNKLFTEGGDPVPPESHTVGTNGRITANGGNLDDNLALAPDVLSPANLRGADGNDRLVGGQGNDTLGGDAGLDLLVGGLGADTLDGGADQDYLDGQDDDDNLSGGSESDILIGGPGADRLDGGAGFDTASYVTATAGVIVNLEFSTGSNDAQGDQYISIERIVGSPSNDIMLGTAGSENFGGGAGDDVLDGKDGDDLLTGDAGADALTGGVGNDFAAYTLSPAAVNVSLLTGAGSGGDAAGDTLSGIENLQGSADFGDTLEGDNGPNWLRSLNGDNVLRGLSGNDLLEGGKDNDRLEGGDGNDTINANQDPASYDPALAGGQDTLLGGAGNDILRGDAGGDTLDGGADADQIFGGKDGDLISGGTGDDLISGGAGNDTIDAGEGTNVVSGNDGNDAITGGSGLDRLNGDAGNDVLTGLGGDDILNGADGGDQINGGDGNDFVNGGDGGDLLDGGTNVDTLSYVGSPGAVSVSLFASTAAGGWAQGDTHTGFENLEGSDVAGAGDVLEGNAGDNVIRGFAGPDTLRGLAGNDLLLGGDGNDLLEVGTLRGPVQDAARLDRIDGGAGFDTVTADFSNQTIPISVIAGQTQSYDFADGAYVRNFENVHDFFTGSGDDVLRLDGAADDAFANLLRMGAGNDTIFSGAGNDTVDGGDGDDLLNGGAGEDLLNAGDGTNVLNGDAGDDVLISGSGPDNVHGGIGNDTASSGAGNDLVFGEDGNDSLDAGIGLDRVDGGAGNDFLSVGALRGPVQDPERLDHLFGGAGFDTITADFSNQTIAMSVVAGQTQSLVFADGAEALDFENVHDFFTGSGNDVLRLDTAADDHFANLLKTGAGDDIVYSGAGSDDVDAADGNDFVNGGSNDVVLTFGGLVNGELIGFTGPVETLAGGTGNDTLSFEGFFKVVPQGSFNAGGFLGVIVNLATNQTDGAARGITISGFENIVGTDYLDNLTGDDGPNIINPLGGGGISPTATFSGGPDFLDGAGGEDTLIIDFSRNDLPDSTGVAINGTDLSRSSPSGRFERWIYQNIERVVFTGGNKNDILHSGSRNYDDVLTGLGGDDELSGAGGADILSGGDGNDILIGQGFALGQYDGTAAGHDVLDGGPGNDLVEDIAFENNLPKLDAANALFQLDGGAGFDRLSVDFSNQTAAIVWDSATPTNFAFADGSFARNFEQLRSFVTGSGSDSIKQLGRVDNQFFLGAGDDTINPGLGVDSIQGGADSDTLIVDYSIGDTPTANGVISGDPSFNPPDAGTFSRTDPATGLTDSIQFRGFEHVRATGGMHNDFLVGVRSGDDVLFGGLGDDTLDGAFGGNDLLDGGEGNDVLRGTDPVYGGGNDTMIGGPGADRFIPRNGSDTIFAGPGSDVITAIDYPTDGYGSDLWDAGDGDDVVTNILFNSGVTYTTAATRMMLDGGAGFDKLTADFGSETQVINFIGGQSNSVDFADGSYFRNFEAIGDFTAGSGDDSIVLAGRADNMIGLGAGNDSVNPGLGTDYLFGGAGNDLLIVDFSVGDDANLGGVTSEGPFLRRRDVGTDGIVDDIFSTEFERVQITGGSKADAFHGLDGNDILLGGGGDDALDGNGGDDFLDGGPGVDTLRGGPGNDTYLVDGIADILVENGGSGNDTVNALADYNLGPNLENLVLGGRALRGVGNDLANIITGNARNNFLDGGDGDDVLTGGYGIGLAGSEEIDRLHGGAGADTFVLGDAASGRFYDDRSSLTPGTKSYAWIDDFTPGQGDKLQLKGGAAEYFLGSSPIAGVPGTALFHDTDLNALLDPTHDELLGIVDSPDALSFANTIDSAFYV